LENKDLSTAQRQDLLYQLGNIYMQLNQNEKAVAAFANAASISENELSVKSKFIFYPDDFLISITLWI
jgi:cytochrome c-type biogenesis protein CcmH/NrfG